MTLQTVPEKATGVVVTATGPISHECPHKDEADEGFVTITWEPMGRTLELHSLAAYLKTWETVEISHEGLTDAILWEISNTDAVAAVSVLTTWKTAGLDVTVVREA
jgi:NADPH-dependent 7-cyano-7-deazaguanine reductase QueF